MEIVEGPKKEPVVIGHKGFDFSYKAFAPDKMGIFWGALQKTFTCKTFGDFKSAHRIKRLCEAVQGELKTFNELMKPLHEIKDDKEREAKMKELLDMKIAIKWDPLQPKEIESIQGLSPADIDGLEFISDPSCFQ